MAPAVDLMELTSVLTTTLFIALIPPALCFLWLAWGFALTEGPPSTIAAGCFLMSMILAFGVVVFENQTASIEKISQQSSCTKDVLSEAIQKHSVQVTYRMVENANKSCKKFEEEQRITEHQKAALSNK